MVTTNTDIQAEVKDSSQEEPMTKEKFEAMLAEGKRAYIVGDLQTASDKLGEATEIAVTMFGEFAPEVFAPYLYYGKALLDLSRAEEGVFSNALQTGEKEESEEGEEEPEADKDKEHPEEQEERVGNPEELTEEEREKIAEIVGEALEENAKALEDGHLPAGPEDTDQDGKEDGDAEKEAKVDEKASDTAESSEKPEEVPTEEDAEQKNTEAEGEVKEGETAQENGNEEEKKIQNGDSAVDEKMEEKKEAEDENNESGKDGNGEDEEMEVAEEDGEQHDDLAPLQIAWEALEVARTICDKHIAEEGWKEKKVEVLITLGECSIEDENYKQAIDDLALCIDLQHSIFLPHDRRIAEANFQMARAYNLDKQFTKAATFYAVAKDILEAHCVFIEGELAKATDEGKEALEKEMEELKALIPDVQAKVDDSNESVKNLAQVAEAGATATEGEEKAVESNSDQPVNDISSLVRKKTAKRAADEADIPVAEESAKRVKQDEEPTEALTTN